MVKIKVLNFSFFGVFPPRSYQFWLSSKKRQQSVERKFFDKSIGHLMEFSYQNTQRARDKAGEKQLIRTCRGGKHFDNDSPAALTVWLRLKLLVKLRY